MTKTLTFEDKQRLFADADAARQYLEALRWPNGPVCPHCDGGKPCYAIKGNGTRSGLYKCGACRKQFTVTVGTIFEDSHIPLNKWLFATDLICSSKKGISAHQLHRMLGLTYKSAWFMAHRIRYAMEGALPTARLTGIVEADETYVGGKSRGGKRGRGAEKKVPVFTMIARDGAARSFLVGNVKGSTLKGLIRAHVVETAHIMTDNFGAYKGLEKFFAGHGVVDHNKEYVRGIIHTNFAESFFSLLKRGILGTFHHVSEQHLQRYLAEFDFRWNARKIEDAERSELAIKGSNGRRLMFRDSSVA
ncbi:MAG: IS1595 family transposase [Thermoanaerobaculales bacterium]